MNKRHYEHTLPNIRGSLSNTYKRTTRSVKDENHLFYYEEEKRRYKSQ